MKPSAVAPMRQGLAALAAAAAVTLGATAARADDPSCAVRASTSRLLFQSNGPVEFGPGWSGMTGSGMFGIRYNFLLLGDYAWQMPGELRLRWPPSMRASAVGDAMGGTLNVQYGLRLQATLSVLGFDIPLPLPMWVGMADRSERGMSRFTPWAWTGADTAVRVTASERLLTEGTRSVPVLNDITYRVWASYELTTTVRTREIAFPQANSSITEMNPEADVPPTANGDVNLPARWVGTLRYVGSMRLRVEVSYCIPVGPICPRRTDTIINQAIPFASATEQQMSVDRSVRVGLPGATTQPDIEVDFGRVRLGLSGRQDVTLRNPGTLTTLLTPQAPMERAFTVATDPLCVTGGATRPLAVRFAPDRAGRFDAVLNLETSAPSQPTISLRLTGEGVDPSSPLTDAGSGPRDVPRPADDASTIDEDGGVVTPGDDAGDGTGEGDGAVIEGAAGCGCRTSNAPRGAGAGLLAVAAAVAALRRRRR